MNSDRPWLTLLGELFAAPSASALERHALAYGALLVELGLATRSQVEASVGGGPGGGSLSVAALSRLGVSPGILSREQLAGSLIASAAEDPDNWAGPYILVSTLRESSWKAWDRRRREWAEFTFVAPEEQVGLHLRAEVRHPGLANIRELGSCDGRTYVAAEHVAGVVLSSLAREDRQELIRAIRDAARAVEALHQRGLRHGGLSLETILIDPQGVVRVTGWGPGASDVPSLGAALFELLGDRPPPGKRPPRFWPRSLTGELRRVVARALADRYPSAGVFARDLSRVLEPG